MREMINYILEANVALLFLLAFYKVFLQNETNFRFLRFFLLAAILFSLAFPAIHLNNGTETNIPSLSHVLPEYWLPEIRIGVDSAAPFVETGNTAYGVWQFAGWAYLFGVTVSFLWLVLQLGYVWIMLRNMGSYKHGNLRIIESAEDKPTFSFFNLVYIGRAHELSAYDKEQIIRHEQVHAQQRHSFDILLVTLLGIVFWFNPFTRLFKKIFVQLHEFEADARAVENSDVNKYCSLLARVALQAHFPIASHFNESLTLKRIQMMKTIKTKIRTWKIAAVVSAFTCCFVIVSCQDQVDDIHNSTISQTGDYPVVVKADMDKYLAEHPGAKLTYMEGDPGEIDKFAALPDLQSRIVNSYDVDKDGVVKKGVLLSEVTQYADNLQSNDNVFMVVEQQPEFAGGFDALKNFLQQNMKYPEAARKAGKTGIVYVSMVINEAGSVSDVAVLKGVDPSMDAEAVRVVRTLPAWAPGKQNGEAVKVRFTLPIRFGLAASQANAIPNANYKMKVRLNTVNVTGNNTTILQGNVKDESGKPLSRANILLAGTTQGTCSDEHGNFSIEVPQKKGKLVFSFVGFDFEEINF